MIWNIGFSRGTLNVPKVVVLCHPELLSGSLKDIEKKDAETILNQVQHKVQHDTGHMQYAPTNWREKDAE